MFINHWSSVSRNVSSPCQRGKTSYTMTTGDAGKIGSVEQNTERGGILASKQHKQPNSLLRKERELRGWSLHEVADQIARLCEAEGKAAAVNLYMVGRWEAGIHRPIPFYRSKLCQLYNLSAVELGFINMPTATKVEQGVLEKPKADVSEMNRDIAVPLPEPVRDTIEAALNATSSPQQCDTIIGQEQETLHMDKVRREFLRQFLGAIISVSLFENEEDMLNLLKTALLPSGNTAAKPLTAISVEEFLPQCAASIKSCWHLMQGREFAIIEEVLSAYFPTLTTLVEQPSEYRKTAASLLTQGYRLKGIAALHYNDLKARAAHCQQAVYFGEIAESPSLLVSALTSLASTSYYSKNPHKAAHIYQQGLLHDKKISPLQLSRLYAELAVVSAQQGQEQVALSYQDIAREIYPGTPEDDPSFIYAEFSPASTILEEGLTYLALTQHYPDRGYDQKAWYAFAQIETLQAKRSVPDRILYEILNHQAATALALRDLGLFCTLMERSIQGAKLLNSHQRRQEAIAIYKDAKNNVWPHESRVRELADVFLL